MDSSRRRRLAEPQAPLWLLEVRTWTVVTTRKRPATWAHPGRQAPGNPDSDAAAGDRAGAADSPARLGSCPCHGGHGDSELAGVLDSSRRQRLAGALGSRESCPCHGGHGDSPDPARPGAPSRCHGGSAWPMARRVAVMDGWPRSEPRGKRPSAGPGPAGAAPRQSLCSAVTHTAEGHGPMPVWSESAGAGSMAPGPVAVARLLSA